MTTSTIPYKLADSNRAELETVLKVDLLGELLEKGTLELKGISMIIHFQVNT